MCVHGVTDDFIVSLVSDYPLISTIFDFEMGEELLFELGRILGDEVSRVRIEITHF